VHLQKWRVSGGNGVAAAERHKQIKRKRRRQQRKDAQPKHGEKLPAANLVLAAGAELSANRQF
jgi:hypothetical protein